MGLQERAQFDVLLVEDNLALAATLKSGLEEDGFRVHLAHACRQADEALRQSVITVVILDLGLPDGDGILWLQAARSRGITIPVLILTARDSVDERVLGLDAGGDDYLAKPFAFSELVARLRVLTRRGQASGSILAVGDLTIDLLGRRAQRDGVVLDLSPLEFDVLTHLAHKAGTPVSRDTLMREVWKIEQRATSMDNVIDVLLVRLREKVDKPFPCPLIRTIRGVGFQLQPES